MDGVFLKVVNGRDEKSELWLVNVALLSAFWEGVDECRMEEKALVVEVKV